jgi:signal transduction histidine kinase
MALDMNSESIAQQPPENARGIVKSWWQNLCNPRCPSGGSVRAERNAIIAVQWLVAIGTSYLVVTVNNWNLANPLNLLLILLALASAAILQRLPEEFFEKRLIESGLLVLDSILIVSAITISQEVPWDLLILFFFCVFIAAIGENLIQIGVGCVLLSVVFLMFVSLNVVDNLTINPNFLFRVPFMFGISIFYGHLASQVKREKERLQKMEEAAKLKGQWVCALAHDIKAPLNVILGHAELLSGAYGGQSDPTERASSFRCIRENIDRIVRLITDFLDVSKLETLKPQSARDLVQMNFIAEDVVLQHRVTARERNLNLALYLDKDLIPILGDAGQLQRALWNLVANAIKFTPSGGNITVTSGIIRKNIFIKIKDTGIGIPKEELPRLFSEFQRLDGAVNVEGTGLGLFIVKTIVDAHNGSISVESEVGVGTTFTLMIPTTKASRSRHSREKLRRQEVNVNRAAQLPSHASLN